MEEKTKIVNVRKIVEEKKIKMKQEVDDLKQKGIIPKLAIILASNDESSRIYINKKRQMCEELGVEEIEYILGEDKITEDIEEIIEKLNNDLSVHGILVQLPLYNHLDKDRILRKISPLKDVDGLSPENLGKLLAGKPANVACTPKGVESIIDSLDVDLTGKNAVVIGRSILVGKPMACVLLNKDATVTVCHSKTYNLIEYTKKADILVVAAGVPHLIKSDMVKEGSVIIDVGINRLNGKLVGDVDTEGVLDKVKYVTPVPGGVGLTTVLSLLENVINVAKI